MHVERRREHAGLGAALAAITACVVGVIANLGVTFAVDSLWPGTARGIDWFVAVVAVVALVALRRFNVGLVANVAE